MTTKTLPQGGATVLRALSVSAPATRERVMDLVHAANPDGEFDFVAVTNELKTAGLVSEAAGRWSLTDDGQALMDRLTFGGTASDQKDEGMIVVDLPRVGGGDTQGDEFLHDLAMSSRPCFAAGYDVESEVCGACPVAVECRVMFYGRLAALGKVLDHNDATEKARIEEEERKQREAEQRALEEAMRRQAEEEADAAIRPLSEQLDILNKMPAGTAGVPAAEPQEPPMRIRAPAGATCYKCGQALPQGQTCLLEQKRGTSHLGSCPR